MPDYSELDELKKILDSHRPLPKEALVNLHEDLVIRWTYHSNAIEGNTLTLNETKVVLEGITVGGKSLIEHLEAVNHKDAIEYVVELVRDNKPLTEWEVKSIHQLVLKKIDDKHAGVYRKTNVMIAGANHIPPDALQVPDQMEALLQWYQNEATTLHTVERSARLHAEFVKIHPFLDGNGRTSRLLMNLELMKAGFPPAILPVEKRLEYYNALDAAHTKNNYEPFLVLIAQIAKDAFKPYWHILGIGTE